MPFEREGVEPMRCAEEIFERPLGTTSSMRSGMITRCVRTLDLTLDLRSLACRKHQHEHAWLVIAEMIDSLSAGAMSRSAINSASR